MKTAPTTSIALLALLGLAGCGGGNAGSGTGAAPAASSAAGGQAQGAQRTPGVSGLIAAVQGTTLQVQDAASQTAVVYTATTVISQTVPVTRSAVAVGLCVAVRSQPATSTASPPATPPPSLVATSVTISAPVAGSCTPGIGGFGRAGGARPSGAPPFVRPSGRPRSRFGGGFGGAFGKVTAVTAGSFTVASSGFGRRTGPPATPSPVTVTTTSATSYDLQQKATPAALKTGLCVTARGPADSTGTVTATSLSLRPAVDGSCTSAFGARNG